MRTAAVLPVKRFASAKQRLREGLPDVLRARLASAMVADVLVALRATAGLELTILVTGERSLVEGASAPGVEVVRDESDRGQSAAVSLGVRRALEHGFERVICVPGDCPALDPLELDALLAAPAHARETVIVPDRHGSGTNALLLAPPDAIAPSFGPDSFERHRALCRAVGLQPRVERVSSLLLDVDTGSDLRELRARLTAGVPRARRTRAVLAESAPARERRAAGGA